MGKNTKTTNEVKEGGETESQPKASRAKQTLELEKQFAARGTGKDYADVLLVAQRAFLAQAVTKKGSKSSDVNDGDAFVTLPLSQKEGEASTPTPVRVKWLASVLTGKPIKEFGTRHAVPFLKGLGLEVEKPGRTKKEEVKAAAQTQNTRDTTSQPSPETVQQNQAEEVGTAGPAGQENEEALPATV